MYKSAFPSFCMYVDVTFGLDVDIGVLAGMRPSVHLPINCTVYVEFFLLRGFLFDSFFWGVVSDVSFGHLIWPIRPT